MNKRELRILKQRIDDMADCIKEQEALYTTVHNYRMKRQTRRSDWVSSTGQMMRRMA